MTQKRSVKIIILVIFILIPLFIFGIGKVSAMYSNMHAAAVLFRAEAEIMQKSPAGQYYESLFWKHNDELIQISFSYPEQNDEFWRTTFSFVPGIEALLNGKGGTVEITAEQVRDLKDQLDWLASVGSPSLKEDIQKEQDRFPLESFIGMTMDEALEFVETNWESVSFGPQTLVPSSNGLWAYTVHNGIYIEYPAGYNLQKPEAFPNIIYLLPTERVPDEWDATFMKIWVEPLPKEIRDDIGIDSYRYCPEEFLIWVNSITSSEFTGVQNICGEHGPSYMVLFTRLYSEQKQVILNIWMMIQPVEVREAEGLQNVINHRYEYLQHLIERLDTDQP